MFDVISVTVAKIKKTQVIVRNAAGQKISWPKQKLPSDIAEGDALRLILTSETDIINQVLNGQKETE